MPKPEILAPAGDFEKLRFAVAYGTDAVYLAGTQYGMRTASENFAVDQLKEAVRYCHARGVKVFVTVNIMPRNGEIERLPQYLQLLNEAGADAMIVADLGVISLAKRYAPDVKLHISTQTSITNYAAACAYHDMGADRVVLARELSMDEIANIRAKTPVTLELETFVHGAMCMAYSGRCMFSNYLTGRDANHGNCAQPCRWEYFITEARRPNVYFPIVEDGSGTYLFNSKDLSMIRHIPELVQAGIDSFKIEGRVKTAYYAAVITNAYRRAVDLFFADPTAYAAAEELFDEVNKVSHREYFTGFYFGPVNGQHQADSIYIRDWDVCAFVEECDADGNARLLQKNKFALDDTLELLMPGKPALQLQLNEMQNTEGESITCAPHPHMQVIARLPVQAPPMSLIRKKN